MLTEFSRFSILVIGRGVFINCARFRTEVSALSEFSPVL